MVRLEERGGRVAESVEARFRTAEAVLLPGPQQVPVKAEAALRHSRVSAILSPSSVCM